MANKVRFGLKNVYYAPVTETVQEDGSIESTYGTVKPWIGAVNLSLSPEGSSETFYADDYAFFASENNAGYSGSIETAGVPDAMLEEIYGMIKDSTTKNVAEFADVTSKYMAIMFEISGDQSGRRYCFYRVKMERPAVEGETITETKTVKTQTCNMTATPRPDDKCVHNHADPDATNYATWFETVPTAPAKPAA